MVIELLQPLATLVFENFYRLYREICNIFCQNFVYVKSPGGPSNIATSLFQKKIKKMFFATYLKKVKLHKKHTFYF